MTTTGISPEADPEIEKDISVKITVYDAETTLSVDRCLELAQEWDNQAAVFVQHEKWDKSEDASAKARAYLALAAIGRMTCRADAFAGIDWMVKDIVTHDSAGIYVHFLMGIRSLICSGKLNADRTGLEGRR